MMFCASEMAVSNYKARLTIETKFRALKTDENEIKAHKITAMLFNFTMFMFAKAVFSKQ